MAGALAKFDFSWFIPSLVKYRKLLGEVLLNSQVQNLVQAMAAFAPPAAGQTTLNANQQAALAPLIAANWQ